MPNVLIHSLVFAPDGVSTAYLYTDLAKELRKLGHSVEVLTTTPHYNQVEEELRRQPLFKIAPGFYKSSCSGISVWHVSLGKRTSDARVRTLTYLRFHLLSLLWSLFHHAQYDVVLAPSPPLSIGVIGWLLARRYGGRCIYNVQELYPDIAINHDLIKNAIAIRAFRALERFVYRRSDAVVTIAERFAAIISDRGVSNERITTIPNFVDTEFYRPLPRDNPFSRAHGLLGKFVVSYAGNIGIAQDWGPLLAAAKNLADRPIQFVIAGEGTQSAWLREQIRKLNLRNVLLLPYQARETIPELNAASDVTTISMSPSGGRDGFPSKIYTTLACAKPSIISAAEDCELCAIIRDSQCGWTVPAGDSEAYTRAILAAMSQRENLHEIGLRGRDYVEQRFSLQAVTRRYDKLIRHLTACKAQGQPANSSVSQHGS
jgi:glycosyltransferase involved in cell wall biosynthesis